MPHIVVMISTWYTTFKTDFDCNNLKHKFFLVLLTSLFSREQHLQHFELNLYGKFENEKKIFLFYKCSMNCSIFINKYFDRIFPSKNHFLKIVGALEVYVRNISRKVLMSSLSIWREMEQERARY